MNRCEKCDVFVYPQHEACPLCGIALEKEVSVNISETVYPAYVPHGEKANFWIKLLLFLSIATGLTCLFINIFTWDYEPRYWSPIVCASAAALCVIVFSIYSNTISPGGKLLNMYIAFIGCVFVIDICTGFDKWSTTYIVPFSTMTLTAIFTILAVRGKKRYEEYLGYLLAVFFISLCPILIFLFSLSQLAWTSFLAALYSFLTAIGLWIFSEKSFRSELKKRFHF